MSTKTLSVVLAILSGASLARSQGTLSWQFDSTAFVVQPTDQILLSGTVSNSSDTPYLIPGAGASFTGDLQWDYEVSWLLALFGRTVPADGTLQFDFCTLKPIGGYVRPGVYVADPISNPAFINFGGGPVYSQSFFQITVVPEPSIMRLGGVGFALPGVLRLRRKVVSPDPPPAGNTACAPIAPAWLH
jgi:hypothetical protein